LDRLEDRTATSVAAISAADPNILADDTGGASYSSVSRDGRYVAFVSYASNQVDGVTDTNNDLDLFLFDRATGACRLVSYAPGSPTTAAGGVADTSPKISDDGRFVAYTSQAPARNGSTAPFNIYLYDRQTGSNVLVNHRSDSSTTPANGDSGGVVISGDGKYVGWAGSASDAVSGQTGPSAWNVFLYETDTGRNMLVSHANTSAVTGADANSPAYEAISGDGRFVAYVSAATNLVAGVTIPPRPSGGSDVFLFDRVTGANTLVSHSAASPTTRGNNGVQTPVVISADGNFIAFSSYASDVVSDQVDNASSPDLFLYDRVAGTSSLVSHIPSSPTTAGNGFYYSTNYDSHSISGDGRFLAFTSRATNLVSSSVPDTAGNDVFLYDRTTGIVSVVSHSAADAAITGNGESDSPLISADGRYVAFSSSATNLVAGQVDRNGSLDAFLYDRVTGSTVLVSHTADSPTTAASSSTPVSLSRDGAVATFSSSGRNLTPGLLVPGGDVFVYDRATGTNALVSRRAPSMPALTAGGEHPSVSADGRFVVFDSRAPNIVSGQVDVASADFTRITGSQFTSDVFLYDRQTGRYTLVSHSRDSALTAGDGNSQQPSISGDGRYVVYQSTATNLVPEGKKGPNGASNIYLFDRLTGTNTLVTHRVGMPTSPAGGLYFAPAAISYDGAFVAFVSQAASGILARGRSVPSVGFNILLYDRVHDAVALVSHAASSPFGSGNGDSYYPVMSADGRYIAFRSLASNLSAGVSDSNGTYDDFLYDRFTGMVRVISRSAVTAGRTGNDSTNAPSFSADGRYVAFSSYASDLVTGVTRLPGHSSDVYLYDVAAGAI
jgi:Tol biopolymer transport system component